MTTKSKKATAGLNGSMKNPILHVLRPLTGRGHAPRINAGIGWHGNAEAWERRAALSDADLIESLEYDNCVRHFAHAFTADLSAAEIRAIALRVKKLRRTHARHRDNMKPALPTSDTRLNYLRHMARPENFVPAVSRTAGEPVLRLNGHDHQLFLTAFSRVGDGRWHLMLSHAHGWPGEFVASGESLATICADFRAERNTAALRRGRRIRRNGPHQIISLTSETNNPPNMLTKNQKI